VKPRLIFFVFFVALSIHADAGASPDNANPAIDMAGYLAVSVAAAQHRQTRRLSEAQFIRMSREPGSIVLDARSRQRFDELHIKGAVNLSFPDIAVASLERVIPDRETRIPSTATTTSGMWRDRSRPSSRTLR
jgi:hypothetical protein